MTLIPKSGLMPRGWYMLKIDISSNTPYLNTKLYVDYGDGFHENINFALIVHSNRSAKRLCYFPKTPQRIRLDPTDTNCNFAINTIKLTKVPRRFAKHRMTQKLLSCQYTDAITVDRAEKHSLKDIWKLYNNYFSQQSSSYSKFDYQRWIRKHEEQNCCQIPLKQFSYYPLISIILPVWNTPPTFLRRTIESVLKQTYPHWQLCICDDASNLPHIKTILNEFSSRDDRILLTERKENGHICRASNEALSVATGDFVALLDHDDELTRDALFEVALALNTNRDIDLIYTDEDFIDCDGHRSNPHFKSDWNPELLRAHNYITHLTVIRRSLIEKAGRFRVSASIEGAQDYDIVLRCSSLTKPQNIHHIPKVLYHWRSHPGSTAGGHLAKPYTVKAGQKALQDYLQAINVKATVEITTKNNFFKINYITENKPLVSLLIPTRDNLHFSRHCIDSIRTLTTYPNIEILILDNQSRDHDTLRWLQEMNNQPRIKVHRFDHPFNFSLINNFGANRAKGDVLGLLNDDVEIISPDWLDEMVSLAMRPENGCIGAKLYYPDNTIQHAGVIIGLGGYAAHSHRGFPRASAGYFNRLNVRQNLSAVTGACLVIRKKIWDQVKGMDESLSVSYNDVDFCLRVLQAGYLNVFTPYAELYHHESKSRGKEDTPGKIARFEQEKAYLFDRWGGHLQRDPYYNPNLTTSREDFSLL